MEPTITAGGYFKKRPEKHKRGFLLRALFLFLLFQQAIVSALPVPVLRTAASYADEACALVLFLVFCRRSFNGFRCLPEERKIILFFSGMIVIGLLSSLFSGLQPFSYVVQDAFLCGKFLFSYLGARALYEGRIPETFLCDRFNGIARLYAVAVFLLMLHEYLFPPFFQFYEVRYSLRAIQLFYPHPTYLACSSVVVLCILAASLEKHPSNLLFIFLLSAVAFMTLRTKAIVFVVLFLGLLLYVCVLKLHSRFALFALLIAGGLCVAWNRIRFYFFTAPDFARPLMLKNSFLLADRYFPFGSGFATFGSYLAGVHYSPLYQSFGYDRIYGMTSTAYGDLTDGFWPIVIGQFGYPGLFCFLMVVFYFLQIIFRLQRKNRFTFLGLLSLFLYMLISSTSESAFFNSFSPMFFLVFGILVDQNIGLLREKPVPAEGFRSKYIKYPEGKAV